MPPHKTMEMFPSESEPPTWTEGELDISSWQEYFGLDELERQRRQGSQRSNPGSRSRSRSEEVSQNSAVPPPQKFISPPMIQRKSSSSRSKKESRDNSGRRKRNHSRELDRGPKLLNAHDRIGSFHRLPSSEPMYHDLADITRSRSFSPEPNLSAGSERLNLYPSPVRSSVLHRSDSIEKQAKRAAAKAKPMAASSSISSSSASSAAAKSLNHHAPPPAAAAAAAADSLLMFSDPADDTDSVMTGLSQLGLISKRASHDHQSIKRTKDKKYKKQREKKKGGVRILNLPSVGLKASPSKRKYLRGIDEQDELAMSDDEQSLRPKSLISRVSSTRSRKMSADSAEPTESRVERRRSWNPLSSLSARSDNNDVESTTQSSQGTTSLGGGPEVDASAVYAPMPIHSSQAKALNDDILAQAAENWIKSNEETLSAQFSVDVEDDTLAKRFRGRDLAYAVDQDSTSSNVSDDERPTEEDGAFPSLNDTRSSFIPNPLSVETTEDSKWEQMMPRSAEWFGSDVSRETQKTGISHEYSDKLSEESPVSVMGVGGPDGHFFSSAQVKPDVQSRATTSSGEKSVSTQRKPLAPPPDAPSRPRSILRQGRHGSFTKEEMAATIEDVRPSRVKFHGEALEFLRADEASITPAEAQQDEDERCISPRSDSSQEEKATEVLSQHKWPEVFEPDESVLSAIPESAESIQTEPSVAKSNTESPFEVAQFPEATAQEEELKASAESMQINPDEVASPSATQPSGIRESSDRDSGKGVVLGENQQGHSGEFVDFEAETPQESVSEGDMAFIETVAAIVIQTAARRILAMNMVDRMLQNMPLSTARAPQNSETADAEDDHHLGIAPRQYENTQKPIAFGSKGPQSSKVVSAKKEHRPSDPSLEVLPYQVYDVAATQIQSTFRGWWVRDSLNVDHFCACRIQRAYRGYSARMSFVFDIYRTVVVQSLWRRKMAMRRAENLRIARSTSAASDAYRAVVVQSMWRRGLTARVVERVRAERRDPGRSLMSDVRRVVIVQSLWRRILAIRKAEKLREESRDRERSFWFDVYRAVIVQSLWRRILAERKAELLRSERRDRERSFMLDVRRTVIVQSLWRRKLALKKAKQLRSARIALYTRMRAVQNDAAIAIQSQWRIYVAQRERLDRLMSVLLLQGVARRWLALKCLEEKRGEQKPVNGAFFSYAHDGHVAISSKVQQEAPDQIFRNRETEFIPINEKDEQEWVQVSNSYDEETLVQSVAQSLNSNAKAEVTTLSAEEVIELFIHMSATKETAGKDAGNVTPLRMDSPMDSQEVADTERRNSLPPSVNSNAVVNGGEKVKTAAPGKPPRRELAKQSSIGRDEANVTAEPVKCAGEQDLSSSEHSGTAMRVKKPRRRNEKSKALERMHSLKKENKKPDWLS